jgi:antitoxin ParD1/3/4
MSIGFRPTREDAEIIQANKRPDESTADVLRRALRALDRERWEQLARKDMERIVASGEDLSDEPDDWGLDEHGQPIDLRDAGNESVPANDGPAEVTYAWIDESGAHATRRQYDREAAWKNILGFKGGVGRVQGSVKWQGLATNLGLTDALTHGDELVRGMVVEAKSLVGPSLRTPLHHHQLSVDRSPSIPPKLARLRAAARRASKR